jgi:Uma2 family endonuclease
MILDAVTEKITPEALLEMPDNNTMELVDGRIVEKQVSANSSLIEGIIFHIIQLFLDAHPVARAYPATLGYRCFPKMPNDIRKPDVTVIRMERLRQLADPDPGYMPIVPDLAVEVLSPNDKISELNEKLKEYREAKFPLVWVVDPEDRSVTVRQLGRRPLVLTDQDEITAPEALPGFSCAVSEFFPKEVAASAG